MDLPFAYAAVFWLALNLALIVVASGRISSARYGPERRAAVRFDAGVPGTLDGMRCKVHEISLTGRAGSDSAPRQGRPFRDAKRHDLTIEVLGQELSFGVLVHRQQIADEGGRRVGLEFLQGQWQLQTTLALALLNRQAAPLQTSSSQCAA